MSATAAAAASATAASPQYCNWRCGNAASQKHYINGSEHRTLCSIQSLASDSKTISVLFFYQIKKCFFKVSKRKPKNSHHHEIFRSCSFGGRYSKFCSTLFFVHFNFSFNSNLWLTFFFHSIPFNLRRFSPQPNGKFKLLKILLPIVPNVLHRYQFPKTKSTNIKNSILMTVKKHNVTSNVSSVKWVCSTKKTDSMLNVW